MPYRKEVDRSVPRMASCKRCGHAVLHARVGRTAALDVEVDPDPVGEREEDFVRRTGGLTWCAYDTVAGQTRIVWRCPGYVKSCTHHRLRDHRCPKDEGRIMEDLFDTPKTTPAGLLPETPKDENPYRGIKDPVTGKGRNWARASSFAKILSDDFMISQWQQRNVALGMAMDEELIGKARGLDVKEDRAALNAIADEAKKLAGAGDAAARGTELHSYTELVDHGRMFEVPEEFHGRMAEYIECLSDHGVEVLPEYIERVTCVSDLGVIGTFDRLVRYKGKLTILDLKTNSRLDYAMREYETQLALYANGVDTHGVYEPEAGAFRPLDEYVCTDTGLIAWLPSQGEGCSLIEVDLTAGWEDAQLCWTVKRARTRKPNLEPLPRPERDWSETFAGRIERAGSRKELESIAAAARERGVWGEILRDMVLQRLDTLVTVA